MMKLKFLFDNRDLAKMLLENWKYDENSLDMLNYNRISSNAVYPFQNGENTRLLRFAPSSEKHKNNILAELEFLRYLSYNQFPALKTVLSKIGEELVTAKTPWGEYYAEVFDKVAGVKMADTDFNESIMYEFGRTLGKLHKLSSKFVPVCKRWSYEDVLLWINSTLSDLPNQEQAIKEVELLHNYFTKIPKTSDTYGLVHYDFELDNVFYDDVMGVCNVIDFDDAMYHWYIMDIEQSLDSIKEDIEPMKYELSSKIFLEGYKSQYPVDDEMLSILPVFRRFANLYSYTRVIRASIEKWENEPKWLIDLRVRLDNSMKSKLASFGSVL